jgi:hypothetical protein
MSICSAKMLADMDRSDNFVHKRDLEAQNRSLYPSDEEWDLDPNGTHLSRSSGP